MARKENPAACDGASQVHSKGDAHQNSNFIYHVSALKWLCLRGKIFLAAQFFIQKIRYLVENISRRNFMFPFTLVGNRNGSHRRSSALPAVRDYDPPISVRRFQSADFSPPISV